MVLVIVLSFSSWGSALINQAINRLFTRIKSEELEKSLFKICACVLKVELIIKH